MNTTINKFQETKEKLNIVDVINEVIPLDDNLKARCPWHDDHEPSFSVNKEGQYFKCFGCGVTGDIFDFYQKWHEVDKGTALKILAERAGVSLDNGKEYKITTTYEYYDESGRFLYAVDRVMINGKKSFRAWRYDGENRVYNLDGVRKVLYKLPELIEGPDPVLILEGEKDVETAISLGFTATTNPFGAGKWDDGYSVYLKGRNCILPPDNDEPGRKHMQEVKESLIRNGVGSAKIFNLPGLKEKQDFTDYINNGGSKEEFLKLIAESQEICGGNLEKTNEDINPFSPRIVEGSYYPIHPALDYTNNFAITTIPLLTEIPDIKEIDGKVKVIGSKKRKENWCITSNKELFLLNDEELSKRGFYLAGDVTVFEPRWDYKTSIKSWIREGITVSPKELFFRIENEYKTYLDYMDCRLYKFFTLWSIGTYFYPLFTGYPIVFLNGDSGTGKSKTIVVTEGISFNAINTGNITDCSIFRLIEGGRCTILLDENEKIANPDEYKEQVNMLLAGFFRGAKVYRTETKGKIFYPKKFEVYSPKLIANIGGIKTEALKNRTIMIKMFPGHDNRQNNYPNMEEPKWQEVRNDLYVFTMNHWKEIKETIPEINGKDWNLSGYFFMMWQPIFVLAKYFSKHIGENLLDTISPLAEQKVKERTKDKRETYNYLIMQIVKEITKERNIEIENEYKFVSTSEIRDLFLKEIGLDPESEVAKKNFDPRKFGHWISNLAIGEPHKIRNKLEPLKTVRGWKVKQDTLDEICSRFNIDGNNELNDSNDLNGNNDT